MWLQTYTYIIFHIQYIHILFTFLTHVTHVDDITMGPHDLSQRQVGDKQRIKFFTDSTSQKRNITRHPLNARQQSGVKQQYVTSCKSRGILEGLRGEPWMVSPAPNEMGEKTGAFLALSFASLTESFYQALLEEPGNPNLRLSLSKGLEARVLHHRTPHSVLKFLIHYHNSPSTLVRPLHSLN